VSLQILDLRADRASLLRLAENCLRHVDHGRVERSVLDQGALIDVALVAATATSPFEADFLFELDGGVVVGNLAARLVAGGCQGDAVVDVEDAGGAAWRPDDGGVFDLVLLGVHLSILKFRAADLCA